MSASMQQIEYRIVLLLIVLMSAGVSIVFRRRAGRAATSAVEYQREGIWFRTLLLTSAGVLSIGTLTALVWPAWMAWGETGLPLWVRWSAVPVAVVGIAMMAWTLNTLGANYTDTVATRESATLVTRGPYRWVRHPYYVAAALVTASVAVFTDNAVIAVSGGAMMLVLVIRTGREEAELERTFGDAYREYRERVGAFCPRWSVFDRR